MTQMTVGPFTWEKREDATDETWELVRDPEADLTYFVVKNYGGEPGPGFKGWKLVSGGPFDAAGAWSSRDEAMAGVVPFLLEWYERQVAELLLELEARLTVLRRVRDELSQGGSSNGTATTP